MSQPKKLILRGVRTGSAKDVILGMWWQWIAVEAERWANQSHSGAHIREMVRLAQTDPAVPFPWAYWTRICGC